VPSAVLKSTGAVLTASRILGSHRSNSSWSNAPSPRMKKSALPADATWMALNERRSRSASRMASRETWKSGSRADASESTWAPRSTITKSTPAVVRTLP
jgi:hypothetical protein